MNHFLVLTFLFFAGSLIGWGIELLWRRFFSSNNPERKWINPGFLTGPYLPLYGFSLILLFLLAHIDVSFVKNLYLQKTVLFVLMSFCITLFEYVAGLIFIKGMKIKLWDYSNCWGNLQGIVCPKYSAFWYVLSAVYYFFVHPKILDWLYWFTNHIGFSFVVGFFYGVFVIDLFHSLNVMSKIRAFAKENDMVLHLEKVQHAARKFNEEHRQKVYFWLSIRTDHASLHESLRKIKEKIDAEKHGR